MDNDFIEQLTIDMFLLNSGYWRSEHHSDEEIEEIANIISLDAPFKPKT